MRIKSLEITNFKAITSLKLDDLQDVVFIAGPNGCGKSCVFDAIRFLKSGYGGYQDQEWQQWFSEQQIHFNRDQESLIKLFQNPSKPIHIRAEIVLAYQESNWLKKNAESLLTEAVWKFEVPELAGWRTIDAAPLATRYRRHKTQIQRRVKEELPQLKAELRRKSFIAEVTIDDKGAVIEFTDSIALGLIFGRYTPDVIGVIEYTPPQRNYVREEIGGINLSIESDEGRRGHHALYNYANKYSNIKTQLASSYIRELIAKEAGQAVDGIADLNETLKELFTIFFPEKEFLGTQPTPEGKLLFNVRTRLGAIHDINELSSGEKEILYGYLRLRNAGLRNSILLIDEPELHLNPRLTEGLPDFYYRHVGKVLGNQLWLVTHSDTLLRQAVGKPSFSVFHMHAPGSVPSAKNQVSAVALSEEIDRAIIELVGDLAAYRPNEKKVFIEGGGDSEFDLSMISRLFPDFASAVNLISTGNKSRVKALHEVLDSAKSKGTFPFDFYSIVDQDTEVEEVIADSTSKRFKWDRYHIENFLIEPEFVLSALNDLQWKPSANWDAKSVEKALKKCAEATIPDVVRMKLESHANEALVGCIRTNVDRSSRDIPSSLESAVRESFRRFQEVSSKGLTKAELHKLHDKTASKMRRDLNSNKWRNTIPGRSVLKRFSSEIMKGYIKYEVLRDLIVTSMKDRGFEPKGMKVVIDSILAK